MLQIVFIKEKVVTIRKRKGLKRKGQKKAKRETEIAGEKMKDRRQISGVRNLVQILSHEHKIRTQDRVPKNSPRLRPAMEA